MWDVWFLGPRISAKLSIPRLNTLGLLIRYTLFSEFGLKHKYKTPPLVAANGFMLRLSQSNISEWKREILNDTNWNIFVLKSIGEESFTEKEHRIIKDSKKKKDANRRAHSKPGSVPYNAERDKHILEEQE